LDRRCFQPVAGMNLIPPVQKIKLASFTDSAARQVRLISALIAMPMPDKMRMPAPNAAMETGSAR